MGYRLISDDKVNEIVKEQLYCLERTWFDLTSMHGRIEAAFEGTDDLKHIQTKLPHPGF